MLFVVLSLPSSLSNLMMLRTIWLKSMLIVSYHRGDYGDAVTVQTLKDFHRERVKILVDAGADLIAFETIPNKLEAKVFTESLKLQICPSFTLILSILVNFAYNSNIGLC